MAKETLGYEVLQKDGKFEIRQYRECITASVEIDSDFKNALNSGFGILADYFFSENWSKKPSKTTGSVTVQVAKSEKIKMTSPVSLTITDQGDGYIISFIMPAKYTKDSLPEPFNKQITFQEMQPYKAAALKFRGHLNENIMGEKALNLESWLKKKDISYKSRFTFALYNPPLIPGRFRRNDIIAKLDEK